MPQCAHHDRIASTTAEDLQPGCSSVGRVLALEARCRRFESCHPDQSTIATHSLLTLHHGADTHSVGYAAVTRRSASSVLVRTQTAPPNIGPLAQSADATPSKGGCSGFESQVAHQDFCPADGIGIRAGLRNQILPVRVRGGAPSKRAAPRRAQSGLENRGIRKGDGSIPSPPATQKRKRPAGRFSHAVNVLRSGFALTPSRSRTASTGSTRRPTSP